MEYLVDVGCPKPIKLPSTFRIRKSFGLYELANKSGDLTKPVLSINPQSSVFYDMLQEFRDWYKKPMTITSNFRQKEFNDKTPHADKRSAHLHGCAVDWAIKGHTTAQRNNVRDKWADICKAHGVIGAVNYYTGGYHLEAFSNLWYKNKSFVVRDYRGTSSDW